MIIVWRGKGYLVAVITFVLSFAAELLVEYVHGDDRYYQVHAWPLSGVLFVSGVVRGWRWWWPARGTLCSGSR